MNLDDIFPIVVPVSYLDKQGGKMPHYKFANEGFVLTWVIMEDDKPMEYVSPYLYNTLSNKYEGWQTQTFENLRLSINQDEIFFTRHKMSSDGKRLLFLVFMNVDGIGSSRVLLSYELAIAFPKGYYIALPDSSCGLVIAKDITAKELEEATKMVLKTYKNAEIPISSAVHAAGEFALPPEWVMPGDEEFSKEMTDEIIGLRKK